MKALSGSVSLLALLAAPPVFACGGPGMPYYGGVGFEPGAAGPMVVLDHSGTESLVWRRGDPPAAIATLPDVFPDEVWMDSAPVLRAQPGGSRLLFAASGVAYDATSDGAFTQVVPPESGAVIAFDAAWPPAGGPMMLIATATTNQTSGVYLLQSETLRSWTVVAAGAGPCASVALTFDASGAPVGMCGGDELRFADGAVLPGASSPFVVSSVAASREDDGTPAFFVTRSAPSGATVVSRLVPDGAGGWTAMDDLATMPAVDTRSSVSSGGPAALAVVVDEDVGARTLWSVVRDAAGVWRAERISAELDGTDEAAIRGDGAEIAAGSRRLTTWTRDASGWQETRRDAIGGIGAFPGACDVSPLGGHGAPLRSTALVLALALVIPALARRRHV